MNIPHDDLISVAILAGLVIAAVFYCIGRADGLIAGRRETINGDWP